MIRIVQEIELENFEAWSGGLHVMRVIKEHDRSSEIFEVLEEYITAGYDEQGAGTDTWVNDFLWFDAEDIIREYLDIELFEY